MHSFTPLKTWSKAKLVVSLHDYSLVCAQKRLMRYGRRCTGPAFMKCLHCATDFYGIGKGVPSTLANAFWGKMQRQVVDMYLPVSQAVVEGLHLDKYQVPYRVMPNFIPDDANRPYDVEDALLKQLPEGDFLLFVGDVVPDKGAEVLLQAYTLLQTEVPLVLIGRTPVDFSHYRSPRVHLMGGWPHDAVMEAWRRCSVAVVPSIVAETFGIVALEATMMGKPVIASRIGGLPDVVVDGETGLLVPPGDVNALRNALQTLLDDPGQRRWMGKMARQRALLFQAKAIVPRVEQIYRELVGTAHSYAAVAVKSES